MIPNVQHGKAYRAEYDATRELCAREFPRDTLGLNSWTIGAVEAVMSSPRMTPAARVQAVAGVLDATADHANYLRDTRPSVTR